MQGPPKGATPALRRTSEAMAVAGMVLIAAVGLYTVVDVVMRYVFNAPLPGAVDIVTYGLAGGVGLVMPYSIVTGQHVAVTFLINVAPPRLRAVLDALILTGNAVFFVVFTWRIASFALERYAMDETMWILGWPVWPAWTLVTAGFGAAMLLALHVALLAWILLFRPLPSLADAAPKATE